jgi:hypothetical protein
MGDDRPPTGIAGAIAQIAAFIDRPWKALVVVVLLVVGGSGYVLYEQRAEIIEAWLTPDTPKLKTELIAEMLERLAGETDADLAQVWSVDLTANAQQFFAARRKDGERPVIPNPRRLPVITTTSDAVALVDVLNGQPSCVNITGAGSPLVRRLAERGMKRGCAVPIPPTGEAFVGVIYLAWLNPTNPAAESDALGAAREVARLLARR